MKLDFLIEKLVVLIKPIVEEKGYEFYHLEFVKENNENYLRVYIDSSEGITLDDCEKVSRAVSDLLDVEDPITDSYYLEVSSPGLNRGLYTDEHIKRNLGNKVLVKLTKAINNKKSFDGVLLEVTDLDLKLHIEGEDLVIPRDKIKAINLEGEI